MKNYVLDTNVLLHDPNSILNFKENNVLVPIVVIIEIDSFKHEKSDRGRNAREASRIIESFRKQGCLSEGVKLPNKGTFRILLDYNDNKKPGARKERRNGHNSTTLNGNNPDKQILKSALRLRDEDEKHNIETILVTKDQNLRILADALHLGAEDYETDKIPLDRLYSGTFDLEINNKDWLSIEKGEPYKLQERCEPNKYCMVFSNGTESRSETKHAYMRVDDSGFQLNRIISLGNGIYGIKPRNREQYFALDALLDDRIMLVTLMGKAGTGKTLLAMAAGLKLSTIDHKYQRVIVTRPTISVGKEIGFLPGTLEEKLNPWMQPIHDALDLLTHINKSQHKKIVPSNLISSGSIVVEGLSYIRGRSIANQFMIIDEAQNLTPIEVKTIVTRAGKGTKIVFTGDPYQIDNPYVDSSSNGFNYVVDKFRKQPIAAHVELYKGERSVLAETGANLL